MNAVERYLKLIAELSARPAPVTREEELRVAHQVEDLWNRLTDAERAEVERRLVSQDTR